MTVRVLLVDDHRIVREGLRAILERDDSYDVIGEAGNGREAVAKVEELAPDVVVMDVAMPGLNGIEATRQIRSNHPRVQIVALSSYFDPRYVKAILGAGASAYVLKTNAYDDLRRAVAATIAGKKYLCAEVTGAFVESALGESLGGAAYEILSPREIEVLQLLAEGLTSSEAASRLFVETSTIETHRRNMMKKLDLHSIADLTRYAVREGIAFLDVPSSRSKSEPE